MHIEQEQPQAATILMDLDEAGWVLAGLHKFHAQLDTTARTLEQQLADAGVTPPAAPDHIRHEYAPPLD